MKNCFSKNMRQNVNLKLLISSMVVIFITAVLLFACNNTIQTQYRIEYIAQTGGSITGKLLQDVKCGENGTEVVAIPDEGYEFVKWSDGKTESARVDTNITKSITLTAEFEKKAYVEPEKKEYKLQYFAQIGGSITGIPIQNVKCGESGTQVVAVPDEGYKFVKWSDGNGSPIRCETNVTSELSVTAEFEFLYEGGTGSVIDPFTIANYTQLNNMWYYPDKNYKLLQDLDLSGISHEPIFDGDREFNGRFYGNDKIIENLHIETVLNFPSLFGVIGGEALIADLNIKNADIITIDYNTKRSGQNYYVGILAGVSMGYLRNINVSGTISVEKLSSDGVAIGGCLGMSYGMVNNCNANVAINVKLVERATNLGISYPFCFGGLVGVCCSTTIEDCYVCGELTVENFINDDSLVSDPVVLSGGLIAYYFTLEGVEKTIKDCQTDIIMTSQIQCAGFIGNVSNAPNSSLTIKNCFVYGDINTRLVSAGFMHSGNNYGELIIEDCSIMSKLIYGNTYASGFLYRFRNSSSSIGMHIKNCVVKSNIGAGVRADGFCDDVAHIDFCACSFKGNINSNNQANGFGYTFAYCLFEKCYAKGNIDGRTFVNGFMMYAAETVINNCYSSVNLICENIYEDKITIVNFAGFIAAIMQYSVVSNCYTSSRIISGDTERDCTVDKSAVFIRSIIKSGILNCHALVEEDSLVQDILYYISDDVDEKSLDITSYAQEEDMYFLADVLNDNNDEIVWINQENGHPILNM